MIRVAFLSLNIILAAAVSADVARKPTRAPGALTVPLVVGVAPAYTVDVTVSFEDVTNLGLATLGMTGHVIDPLDLALAARLPDPAVTIPAAFPVRVDIDPPDLLLELEFDGVASVTLDTTHLPYSPGTRLRLFSADDSLSPYVDITEEVSEGSYRVRGSRGEFSEFMIVLDERDAATVVDGKFTRLSSLMTTHGAAIDSTVFSALSALESSAHANWLADDIDAAKTDVSDFIAAVIAASPAEIPDTWADGVINIAGLLRAAAGTLLFSLEDARDTDFDAVYDYEDNCTLISNPGQCDTNGDGYGNHCDADLDGNGVVNSGDLSILRANFGVSGINDADLNCNGIVNSGDLSIMRGSFGAAPGPTAP